MPKDHWAASNRKRVVARAQREAQRESQQRRAAVAQQKPLRRKCHTCNNTPKIGQAQCGKCLREQGRSVEPECPRCKMGMVRRRNRKEGSFFWGCRNYPECRGTRPIEGATAPPKVTPRKALAIHPLHKDSLDLPGVCVKCGEDAPKRFDGLCAFCYSRLL